jgi:hypothetical protein
LLASACFLGLINSEIFIPTKNGTPQKTGTLRLLRGIKSKNGPGHSPPIPQPRPNKKDPMISFQSIWPLGSEIIPLSESNKVFFLQLKKVLHSLSHNIEKNEIDQNS